MRKRSGLAPKMLEFSILTAARTGEAVGAKWDEIDLKAGVWTVPGDRMKAGREHRVPLSDRALEILLSLPTGARPNVFSLGDKAMWKLLARMKRTDVTVHGFRSSFRDYSLIIPTMLWKWRSPMLWVTRWRPPTGAVTCSISVDN